MDSFMDGLSGRVKRNEMLVNIVAQLIHNPDEVTATHIKNFVHLPRVYDKPALVQLIWDTLGDDTEMDPFDHKPL